MDKVVDLQEELRQHRNELVTLNVNLQNYLKKVTNREVYQLIKSDHNFGETAKWEGTAYLLGKLISHSENRLEKVQEELQYEKEQFGILHEKYLTYKQAASQAKEQLLGAEDEVQALLTELKDKISAENANKREHEERKNTIEHLKGEIWQLQEHQVESESLRDKQRETITTLKEKLDSEQQEVCKLEEQLREQLQLHATHTLSKSIIKSLDSSFIQVSPDCTTSRVESQLFEEVRNSYTSYYLSFP